MKHYSKKYLSYNLFISFFATLFGLTIIFLQVFFEENSPEYKSKMLLFFILLFIGLEIILIILHILSYKFITYEIKDDLIELRRGIIFKRVKILRFEKMHAIDIKQNIIHKLFKIKRLAIDSGSTTRADLAEIVIYEDEETIRKLEKDLKLKLKGKSLLNEIKEDRGEVLYQYSSRDKVSFVLMTTLSIIIFSFILFFFLSIIFSIFIKDIDSFKKTIYILLAILFGGAILSFVTSYIYILIRYYNYEVLLEKDHLKINHGLLTKVSHLIYYNRIKAIRVEEGLIKRLFKYASLKLEVVGFGERSSDENNKTYLNYLAPLCKRKDIKEIISRLNLEFEYKEKTHASPRRAFRYFLSLPLIIFSIIYFSLLPLVINLPYQTKIVLFLYFLLYAVVCIFILLFSILSYKNSGLYFDNQKTILYFGSFNRQSLIIPNKNITELVIKDTYLRRRRKIASFNIHYFNNAYKNDETALLLDNSLFDELKSKLNY